MDYWFSHNGPCLMIHKLPKEISEKERIFVVPFITKYPLRHSQKCRYIILGNSHNGKSICLTSLENSYQVLPRVKISRKYKEYESLAGVLNKIVRKHIGKERSKLEEPGWVEPSDLLDTDIELSRYKRIKLAAECFPDSESEEGSLDDLDISDIEDSFPTDIIQPRAGRELQALDSPSEHSSAGPSSPDGCFSTDSPQVNTSVQNETPSNSFQSATLDTDRPGEGGVAKGKVFVKPLQSLQSTDASRSEYSNQARPSPTFMCLNPSLNQSLPRNALSVLFGVEQRSQEQPLVHWHSPAPGTPETVPLSLSDSDRLACIARKRAHNAAFSTSQSETFPSVRYQNSPPTGPMRLKGPSEFQHALMIPRFEVPVTGPAPAPIVPSLRDKLVYCASTSSRLPPNNYSSSTTGVTTSAAFNNNNMITNAGVAQPPSSTNQPLSALQKTVSDIQMKRSVRNGNFVSYPRTTASHTSNPVITFCSTSVIKSPSSIGRTTTAPSCSASASHSGHSSRLSKASETPAVNKEHSQGNLLDYDGHAMSILELENVIPMLKDEVRDLTKVIHELQARLYLKKQSLSKYNHKQQELSEIRNKKMQESEHLKSRIIFLKGELMKYNVQGGSCDKHIIHSHIKCSEEHQRLVAELQKITGRNVNSSLLSPVEYTINPGPVQTVPRISPQDHVPDTGGRLQRESPDLTRKINVLHELFYTPDKTCFADGTVAKHLVPLGLTPNLVEAYFEKIPQDKLFVANNMAYQLHHYLLRVSSMKIENLVRGDSAGFLRFSEAIVQVLNYLDKSYNVRIDAGGQTYGYYQDLLAGMKRRIIKGFAGDPPVSSFPRSHLEASNATTSASVSWPRHNSNQQSTPLVTQLNCPMASLPAPNTKEIRPAERNQSFLSPSNPNGQPIPRTHSEQPQPNALCETSVSKPEVSKPSCIVAPWMPRHVMNENNPNCSGDTRSSPCGMPIIDHSPGERVGHFSTDMKHNIEGKMEPYRSDSVWKRDGAVSQAVQQNSAQPNMLQMASFPYKTPMSGSMFSTALSLARNDMWAEAGTHCSTQSGPTYPGIHTTMGQDARESGRGVTYPQYFNPRGPPF